MEKGKEETDVKVPEDKHSVAVQGNYFPSKSASSNPEAAVKEDSSPKDNTTDKTVLSKQDDGEDSLGVEDVVSGLATTASSWLSGWMKSLEVAKDKSAEVYGMVKKDLSEFSEAVQSETSALVSETGSMLQTTSRTIKESLQLEDEASTAGQVKKSVSGFLSHVQKAFTPDTMQDDDAEAYILRDGQPVLLDRLQTELYRLAGDPQTFLAEIPEAELVRYEIWSADVDLDARQTELSDLLASNKAILDQYTRLVPAHVSHANFWYRYLFHVHLAEERDKQREFLRKRAEQLTTPGAAEKQVAWEEVYLDCPEEHSISPAQLPAPASREPWPPITDEPTRLLPDSAPCCDPATPPVTCQPTSTLGENTARPYVDRGSAGQFSNAPPLVRHLTQAGVSPTSPILKQLRGGDGTGEDPRCEGLREVPGERKEKFLFQKSKPKEDFSDHVDVTDAQADRLLEEYDQEMRKRSSPPAGTTVGTGASSTAGAAKGTDDRPGTGTTSPERVSSNDDDWVKEDLKDLKEELDTIETNSSVSNDWEKWE